MPGRGVHSVQLRLLARLAYPQPLAPRVMTQSNCTLGITPLLHMWCVLQISLRGRIFQDYSSEPYKTFLFFGFQCKKYYVHYKCQTETTGEVGKAIWTANDHGRAKHVSCTQSREKKGREIVQKCLTPRCAYPWNTDGWVILVYQYSS